MIQQQEQEEEQEQEQEQEQEERNKVVLRTARGFTSLAVKNQIMSFYTWLDISKYAIEKQLM